MVQGHTYSTQSCHIIPWYTMTRVVYSDMQGKRTGATLKTVESLNPVWFDSHAVLLCCCSIQQERTQVASPHIHTNTHNEAQPHPIPKQVGITCRGAKVPHHKSTMTKAGNPGRRDQWTFPLPSVVFPSALEIQHGKPARLRGGTESKLQLWGRAGMYARQ